jgi:peptidoglycan hydrolase CwlO-like protein
MKVKSVIAAVTIFTALSGAALHVSLARAADADMPAGPATPAMPDDQVATEALNSVIADCNRSETDRFKAQEVKFEQAKQQNDMVIKQYREQNDTLQKQYDVLRTNYTTLAKQSDDLRKQNEDLQQKYQDMQQKLQDAQQKYDAIDKKLNPPKQPGLVDKLKDVF